MTRDNSLNSVSREKYNIIKDKLTRWIEEHQNLKEKNDQLKNINKKLLIENDDQLKNIKINQIIIEDLKKENKNILYQLERESMLKDGIIQRLEESKKDMKEMYLELKEDFREQSRWIQKKEVK